MNQRGTSESTQWALIVPFVFGLVLGLLQVGVWLHAQGVANQAASAAADRQAVVSPGPLADARAAAERVAGGTLQQLEVRVDREPDRVLVVVTGRAHQFFDIGLSHVEGRAVLPVERVTRP